MGGIKEFMLNLLVVLILLCLPALAVIEAPVNPIDFEQNPSDINWKKIDTENFEIIFPEEITNEAMRVAHIIERAYPFVSRSLEIKPARIPLVLQNQSVTSNGFVTLAPRRSEWFMTPSIDPEVTNTEWIKTLAIHEFRHVVQFQKTRQNFNRYFEILLGEIGQALGLAFTLPPWALEGDAVGIETALTRGGRGRLPLFERDLRTLLLSGKDFDFDKSIFRSYKDWVPSHYVYGYFLTTHMRNQYGDLFLSHLADQSSKTSWNPLSFYNSSDRMLEGNFEDFYANAMKTLVMAWKKEADKLKLTPYVVKTLDRPFGWTNYYYPMVTSEGMMIALKSGLSFINHFVLLNGKQEEVLFWPGSLAQEWPFKLRKDRFAFLEMDLDPRWGYRDHASLRVYDVKERKFILTVPGTKLRLAALNHDADKVLAVEWAVGQKQSVVVLDLLGRETKRIPLSRDEVVTSIDWLSDDEVVMVTKDFNEMKSIVALDLRDEKISVLIPKETTNFGFINVSEGKVLIESPASGIDNIFVLEDGKLRQLTTSRFGASAPLLHHGRLIYNNYSVDGMDIVEKTVAWDHEEPSQGSFVPFYEKFAKFEDRDSFAAGLGQVTDHEVKDYSQIRNALNLHSWMIVAPPLSNSVALVGYSRDILNKFSLSAGAEYNLNEKTLLGFASAAWSHYYPVFDLRTAYGGRRQKLATTDHRTKYNKWEEGTLEAGIQVPWRKITGRFNQVFATRAFGKLIHATDKITSDVSEVSDGTLFSPGFEAEYSILQRTALRDLYPPLGASLNAHLEEGKDISGADMKGSILGLDSRVFLPGPMKHHSFYQQLAYEKQRDKSYQYSSFVLYPRGTSSLFLQEFRKYSANYTLPLFYPDRHWSRYLYFKRIALNAFYDELNGRYQTFNYKAASTGWEVLFETHLLRLMLPLTWGVRGSYIINGFEKGDHKYNYELFIASTLGTF